mgnify:CR=1 FL=1|tara:strand:+ start:226 stop:417 length:192 start_codon:yes stop_codon:yes gene_type:complete
MKKENGTCPELSPTEETWPFEAFPCDKCGDQMQHGRDGICETEKGDYVCECCIGSESTEEAAA